MAVDLSLETAEKYFWTWLDFIRLGPVRFRLRLRSHPDRYLTSGQFFLGTMVVCAALWLITIGTIREAQISALRPYTSFMGNNSQIFIGRRVLYVFVSVIAGAAMQRLVIWWPLGSPADIADLLTAKFYGSAIFAVLVALDCLLASGLVLILPYIAAGNVPRLIILCSACELFLFTAVGVYYDIWSLSAFCRLRVRRLLEGLVILWAGLAVLGASIGGIIGGMIGGMSDALKTAHSHTLTGIAMLAATFAFVFVLSVGLGSLPLAGLFLVLRKRLPKLRQAVQEEYANL
ncbi:MAG: hypothetical protein ABSF64_10150 [Bryobacteraceae bacterium]|jgi:hypothetical protein